MEQLAKIIAAIENVVGVSKVDILTGTTHRASYARKILSHIVRKDYPIAVFEHLAAMTSKTVSAWYKQSQSAELLMAGDDGFFTNLNNVRTALGLKTLRKPKRYIPVVAVEDVVADEPEPPIQQVVYKNPFGIEYTELDEIRMRRIKQLSVNFMRKYCALGQQPLKKGFARTRCNKPCVIDV